MAILLFLFLNDFKINRYENDYFTLKLLENRQLSKSNHVNYLFKEDANLNFCLVKIIGISHRNLRYKNSLVVIYKQF